MKGGGPVQLNNTSNYLLKESKVRPLVITFGRFQPPTVGHQLLIDKVVDVARKNGGEHRIYVSRVQDAKKNPLSTKDKIKYMRKFFKKANIVDDKKSITIFHALESISDQGYKNVILVVGSDRVSEFKKAISKYIGPDGYQFDKFTVVSAGDRDPDATGVSGMSASKVRNAVQFNKLKDFKLGMPSSASKSDVETLWTLLRKTMRVEESVKLNKSNNWVNLLMEEYLEEDCDVISEISRTARRNMSRAARRTSKIRARRRKVKAKFRKGPLQLKAKAMKQARDLLRQKIAKGVDWNTASISTKERVEKLLNKKKTAIFKISKKLLPGVRKAEAKRVADLKSKANEAVELLREPEILDRLVQQLMDKGKSKDAAYAIANSQLQKNGVTKKGSTELTKHGKKRNSMTAGERAKDRAAKKDGKSPKNYNYNPRTNTATQKESVDERLDEAKFQLAKKLKMRKFDRDERKRKKKIHKANVKYSRDVLGIRDEVEVEEDTFKKKAVRDVNKKYDAKKKAIQKKIDDLQRVIDAKNNIDDLKTRHSAAVKKRKDAEEKIKASNKRIAKLKSLLKDERDYKQEYANFHGKPEQRAKRSKRVLARRKLEAQGRVSKGDGKDVDHKDGNANNNSDKNLRVMNRHTNRSRNNNKQHEEHGAGEEGTPKLVKRLKKDTPSQN